MVTWWSLHFGLSDHRFFPCNLLITTLIIYIFITKWSEWSLIYIKRVRRKKQKNK